ncbi:hypothetical protein AX16_005995 [Volvariella volvacea WC 439]|nr:hypothetical protein AX16_005995 [Volvariella volvacea WC 439]
MSQWLEMFKKANAGDLKLQNTLFRYTRFLAFKFEQRYWKQLIWNEMAWQERLKNRPIMTGGYLRASIYNKPLPRLKPQPLHITRMIYKRRRVRERRILRIHELQEMQQILRHERDFESQLAKLHPFETTYAGEAWPDWEESLVQERQQLQRGLDLDVQRAQTPFDPKLVEQIKQARREKIANKTRELERERRGEVLKRTIRRRNQGPPAHVLRRMSPERREMDKVVRSVSEVGYVAQVKMQLGFKLRNPTKWKEEFGPADRQEELCELEDEIRRENAKRRLDPPSTSV